MNLQQIPNDLPIPEDDGACDHLTGMALPEIELICTDDSTINLGTLTGYSVIYIYPMTGRPDIALPEAGMPFQGHAVVRLNPAVFVIAMMT